MLLLITVLWRVMNNDIKNDLREAIELYRKNENEKREDENNFDFTELSSDTAI